MPEFRRYFVPGGTYFFTLVAAGRRKLFAVDAARKILGDAIRDVQNDRPFELMAIVLLPDHLHTIWALPPGDACFSERLSAIKAKFTSEWLASGGSESKVSDGYRKQRRRGVWQARFMEHTIRDERDLNDHANYLHWNPVKHGYAPCVKDWPWSSFHRYVRSGDYPLDWGCSDRPSPDFGNVDESLIE